MKKGFTLVELLVVVLIIGVLTAIAVPMYQKAVLKSRFAALIPIGKAMADSNEAYYLEHNAYASNPQDLPVQGQEDYDDGTSVDLVSDENFTYTISYNADKLPDNNYIVFQKHSMRFSDTTMCEARDEEAGKVCESFGGTPLEGGVTAGWTAYLLSGNAAGSNFEKECTGSPETEQTCSNGCGEETRSATCDTRTGEWNYGEWDESSCPAKPAESQACNMSNGTSAVQTRSVTCEDGTWVTGEWSVCDIPCTGSQPATINASSGATGTATCVNGQWVYEWTGGTEYENYQVCHGDSAYACAGGIFKGFQSKCNGNTADACPGGTFSGMASVCFGYYSKTCYQSTFSGENSHCDGVAVDSCRYSTFSGQGSRCSSSTSYACGNSTFSGANTYCTATGANACANSLFSGDKSWCSGGAANACAGSVFQAGSACYANQAGGCDGAIYTTHPEKGDVLTGCCSGSYCPAGSPKCGSWNNTTHAYDIDGTW